MKKRMTLTVVGLLGIALGSASVRAGQTFLERVVINDFGGGSGEAEGTVYATNTSTDYVEQIGCDNSAWNGTTSLVGNAYCYAEDATGRYRVCYAATALQASIMATVNSTSYIAFYYQPSYYCQYLDVQNGSRFYTP